MGEGSVTTWLHQLRAGESQADEQLWRRYFEQFVRIANRKLQGSPTRTCDGEDVAAKAFASFFRGVEAGRFPGLERSGKTCGRSC